MKGVGDECILMSKRLYKGKEITTRHRSWQFERESVEPVRAIFDGLEGKFPEL